MPVVLDATVGSPTANSYVDVAESIALLPFVASKARSDAWSKLTSDDQATYLIRATKLMEAYFEFDGIRLVDTQPLQWPRDWAYGPDRQITAFPVDKIPDPIKEAQALLALNLSEGFDAADGAASPINEIKISSLQVKFDSMRAARGPSLVPSEVIEKLRGWGDYVGLSGMARSVPITR